VGYRNAGISYGGMLLADVRVSFVDLSTRRTVKEIGAVQKEHPIASKLAIAFSGSVEAGLFIANQLKRSLAGMPVGKVWSPAYSQRSAVGS
jgi:hypothetical protein